MRPPLPRRTRKVLTQDGTFDMTLVVGTAENQMRFQVRRQIVRDASAIWRRIYDPDTSFSEQGRNTFELPEDDPDALEIILNISHLRFDKIPQNQKLDMDLVDRLASACDKNLFDNVHLLRDFDRLHGWTVWPEPQEGARNDMKRPPLQADELLRLLRWAWATRRKDLFQYVVREAALQLDSPQNGQTAMLSRAEELDMVCDGILDYIMEAKAAGLLAIECNVKNTVQSLWDADGTSDYCPVELPSKEWDIRDHGLRTKEACLACQYRTMMRSLRDAKLLAPTDHLSAAACERSLRALLEAFAQTPNQSKYHGALSIDDQHKKCSLDGRLSWRLQEKATAAMDAVPLAQVVLNHFESTAKTWWGDAVVEAGDGEEGEEKYDEEEFENEGEEGEEAEEEEEASQSTSEEDEAFHSASEEDL